MEISGLIAKIGVDLSEFERGIAKMQGKLEDTASKMATVGKKMSLMITAPIAALGTGSFKLYKDYESVVNRITSLTVVSKEAWKGLEQDVKNIAETTGKSLKEVSEGFYFIASAGFQGAEAVDILDKATKAAATGLGISADITQLLTSVLQAYGKENIDAAKATDILIRSVKDGKAEAADMATNLGRILPIASQMNIGFEQVSAAVAGLTLIGMDVPEAVTAIRGVLNEMLNMSEQGKQALLEMGTSYDELYNVLKTQGLLPFLKEIDGLVNQFGERSIAKVFTNVRALTGVLGLVGKNAEQVEYIFNDIAGAGGDLDKAFANTQQTLQYKWNVAMEGAKSVLIELGDGVKGALVPILEKFSVLLKRVSEYFAGLSDKTKTTIVVVGGLVAAIGPALLIGSQIIKMMSAVIPLITTLKTGFVGLQATMVAGTAGLKGFNLAFTMLGNLAKANPFGLILTGATLLVPVITKLIGKHKELNKEVDNQKTLQDYVNEAVKNSTLELVKEQTHLQTTIERIMGYNEGNRNRVIELKKLIAEYPNYFANLNAEKATNAELSVILNNINKDYEKRIALMATEEEQKILVEGLAKANIEYQKALEKRKKLEEDINKNTTSTTLKELNLNEVNLDNIDITNTQTKTLDEINYEYKKNAQRLDFLNALYDENEKVISSNEKTITDIKNRLKELMGVYDDLTDSTENNTKTTTNTTIKMATDVKSATNELLDSWKNYMSNLQSTFRSLQDENYRFGKDEVTLLIQERNNVKAELDEQIRVWQEYLQNKKNITKEEYDAVNELIRQGNEISLKIVEEYNKKIANIKPIEIGSDTRLQRQIDSYNELRSAFEANKISYEQYINAIATGNYDIDTMIAKNEQNIKLMNEMQNAMTSLVTGIASGIGEAVAGVKSFGEAILGTVMDVVKGLLQIAIAEAVKGIFGNSELFAAMGPAGIAVLLGMSTMALAGITALHGKIQGLAEGGLVTKGGSFIVGERGREMVTLPAGSAVTPIGKNINNNIYLAGELSTRVRGEDLEFVLDRVNFKNKKR